MSLTSIGRRTAAVIRHIMIFDQASNMVGVQVNSLAAGVAYCDDCGSTAGGSGKMTSFPFRLSRL